MSERQREGDRYLASPDEEEQEREDEAREAFLQETRLGILQAADELAEWTDVFNRYINYLLLIQHPHDFQLINTSTIVGAARQRIASTTLTLIDPYFARLVEQAALPPEWVPPRYGRPSTHREPEPNPAEDSDTSNPEDQR